MNRYLVTGRGFDGLTFTASNDTDALGVGADHIADSAERQRRVLDGTVLALVTARQSALNDPRVTEAFRLRVIGKFRAGEDGELIRGAYSAPLGRLSPEPEPDHIRAAIEAGMQS